MYNRVAKTILVLFSMIYAAAAAPVSGDGYDADWYSYTTISTTTEDNWNLWNDDFYSVSTVPYYYTTWSYYTITYTYTYYSSGSGTAYYVGGGGGLLAVIVCSILCCRAGMRRRQVQRPPMRVIVPPNPNLRVPGTAIPVRPVAPVPVVQTGTPAGQFNPAFNNNFPRSTAPKGAPPSYDTAIAGASSESTSGANAPPSVGPQINNPEQRSQNTDQDNLLNHDALAIETSATFSEVVSTSTTETTVPTATMEPPGESNETKAVKHMTPTPEQDTTSRDSVCLLEYDHNNIPEEDEAKKKSTV